MVGYPFVSLPSRVLLKDSSTCSTKEGKTMCFEFSVTVRIDVYLDLYCSNDHGFSFSSYTYQHS